MLEPAGAYYLVPQWPKPAGVRAVITTRGYPGRSLERFARFNLAQHVNDHPSAVANNRLALEQDTGAVPVWLEQVHSTRVVGLEEFKPPYGHYDGSFTTRVNVGCTVLTADCLPVLLCDREGAQVMCLHAGWRGLAAGILSRGVKMFADGSQLLAYLGPAISAQYFEVGNDVRQAFLAAEQQRPFSESVLTAFTPSSNEDSKYYADLFRLASSELRAAGEVSVYGGEYCTVKHNHHFYSHRKEGETGRFATMIWRAPS